MIDEPFRNKLSKFSGPLIHLYSMLGLSPNHITLFALILGATSSFMVAQKYFMCALGIWWLGRLFDGTDGIYARATNQTSSFGAHFDILADMFSYSMMIIGFHFAFPDLSVFWIIILILYVLCITGALSLGALEDKLNIPAKSNRGLRLASGIAEGGETGIAYTTFLLFPSYIEALILIWIFVLMITVVARLILAKKELQ